MSSISQQQANRLNAQKSTGPRTLQGKAVSRFNALKTGIDAESQIIPGEDPGTLDRLAEEYHQRWQPALPEQRVLVDTLAHDEWQLRRLRKAEASLWRSHAPEDKPWDGEGGNDFARLQRRLDSTERSFRLTLEKLECMSAADVPVCLPEPVQPSHPPISRKELPDLYEPISPRNQRVNPGIGFVPPTSEAAFRRPLPSLSRLSAVAISTFGSPVSAPKPTNRA